MLKKSLIRCGTTSQGERKDTDKKDGERKAAACGFIIQELKKHIIDALNPGK